MRWKSYGPESDEWVLHSNLDCPTKLAEFHAREQKAIKDSVDQLKEAIDNVDEDNASSLNGIIGVVNKNSTTLGEFSKALKQHDTKLNCLMERAASNPVDGVGDALPGTSKETAHNVFAEPNIQEILPATSMEADPNETNIAEPNIEETLLGASMEAVCNRNDASLFICNEKNADGKVCGEVFKRKYGLNRHNIRKHKINLVMVVCSTCSRQFKTKENLRTHQRIMNHGT